MTQEQRWKKMSLKDGRINLGEIMPVDSLRDLWFIDKGIRKLIYFLNQKGFYTKYCCKGKHTHKDFIEDNHSCSSYISFVNPLSKYLLENFKNRGFCFDKDGKIIRAGDKADSLTGPNDEYECLYNKKEQKEIIFKNKAFIEAVKTVFGFNNA